MLPRGRKVLLHVAVEIGLAGEWIRAPATIDRARERFVGDNVRFPMLVQLQPIGERFFAIFVKADVPDAAGGKRRRWCVVPETSSAGVKKKTLPELSFAANRGEICRWLHAKLGKDS